MNAIILFSFLIGFVLGMCFEIYMYGYLCYYWDKYIRKI